MFSDKCGLESEVLHSPPVPSAPVATAEVPSLPTQIVPQDVEGEILGFEAWKQKQLQAAAAMEVEVEEVREEAVVADGAEEEGKTEGVSEKEIVVDENGKKNGAAEKEEKKPGSTPPPPPKPKSSSSSSQNHRYNYASPDCSARIISASSSSSHPSSILHKSKDRYMLTPCNTKEHWVIIELCDEIRVEGIEVGMFEFFSGVVKEITLSVGDDDEDDDGGWAAIANFTANNVRGSQTFNLPHPSAFHRQIRLDFPSHYGKEYYCPISSVKVYGMNQMEAFKWESRRGKPVENRRVEEVKESVTATQAAPKVSQASSSASSSVSPATNSSVTSSKSSTSLPTPSIATQPPVTNSKQPEAVPEAGIDSANASEPLQTPRNSTRDAVETPSSTINASTSTSSSPPAPIRSHAPKADSSESIYAFIIRRLTALEGNATLGMMYVEEQTKSTRGMAMRLEKVWEQWKVDEGRDLRMALEREVSWKVLSLIQR